MIRTSTRLSDGRELIYFDERATGADGRPRDRSVVDGRGLEPVAVDTWARLDPLRDEWVVVAAHRQGRTHLPPASDCPLDPSSEGRLTEVPAADYDVVVFENRFPSLQSQDAPDAPDAPGLPGLPGLPGPVDGPGLTRLAPGTGRCEVICFSPEHEATFSALPATRLRTIVDVWADRTSELALLPGVEEVFVFENRGVEIGVTLSHPHGQVYAYPFLTPATTRLLDTARRHLAGTGRCLACDVLAAELADERVVAATDSWVAYVPAAARWPFEVHLVPRRHLPDLPATTEEERTELSLLQADVLARLDGLFGLPMPYMAGWHQAPVRVDRGLAHLRLEIVSSRRTRDKLKFLASSESVAGVFINDVAPEKAADLLRRAPGRPS